MPLGSGFLNRLHDSMMLHQVSFLSAKDLLNINRFGALTDRMRRVILHEILLRFAALEIGLKYQIKFFEYFDTASFKRAFDLGQDHFPMQMNRLMQLDNVRNGQLILDVEPYPERPIQGYCEPILQAYSDYIDGNDVQTDKSAQTSWLWAKVSALWAKLSVLWAKISAFLLKIEMIFNLYYLAAITRFLPTFRYYRYRAQKKLYKIILKLNKEEDLQRCIQPWLSTLNDRDTLVYHSVYTLREGTSVLLSKLNQPENIRQFIEPLLSEVQNRSGLFYSVYWFLHTEILEWFFLKLKDPTDIQNLLDRLSNNIVNASDPFLIDKQRDMLRLFLFSSDQEIFIQQIIIRIRALATPVDTNTNNFLIEYFNKFPHYIKQNVLKEFIEPILSILAELSVERLHVYNALEAAAKVCSNLKDTDELKRFITPIISILSTIPNKDSALKVAAMLCFRLKNADDLERFVAPVLSLFSSPHMLYSVLHIVIILCSKPKISDDSVKKLADKVFERWPTEGVSLYFIQALSVMLPRLSLADIARFIPLIPPQPLYDLSVRLQAKAVYLSKLDETQVLEAKQERLMQVFFDYITSTDRYNKNDNWIVFALNMVKSTFLAFKGAMFSRYVTKLFSCCESWGWIISPEIEDMLEQLIIADKLSADFKKILAAQPGIKRLRTILTQREKLVCMQMGSFKRIVNALQTEADSEPLKDDLNKIIASNTACVTKGQINHVISKHASSRYRWFSDSENSGINQIALEIQSAFDNSMN